MCFIMSKCRAINLINLDNGLDSQSTYYRYFYFARNEVFGRLIHYNIDKFFNLFDFRVNS